VYAKALGRPLTPLSVKSLLRCRTIRSSPEFRQAIAALMKSEAVRKCVSVLTAWPEGSSVTMLQISPHSISSAMRLPSDDQTGSLM
jgi:hypothetical protein